MPLRILLLNPPHTAIGSRIPTEQLPPLGLLSIGGPLLDAGFTVELLDADLKALGLPDILHGVLRFAPDVLMIGHAGSTSAHPTVVKIARALKQSMPQLTIVYGGVYPTYHWQDILRDVAEIDVIVRGEGERTTTRAMQALAAGEALAQIEGLAFRQGGQVVGTSSAPMIQNLDDYRVGWELIDHDQYSYWGRMKAVVVQFSRGCPFQCSYCGQRGFWTQWRHRDPVKFAAEIARMYRQHGVELFNFADELPTGSRPAWKAFLEALIAENVPVTLVGSTRAGDIVRDADILHLYRKAGVIRFLLGIENYDQTTLQSIRKGSTTKDDREAIRLLRQHGILSMATYVLGFEEETEQDYRRSIRQLLMYDPDQIQMLYITPHRWTPFFNTVKDRRVILSDQTKWDYKHQVLATQHVPTWKTFVWFKAIELIVQLRPRMLWRMLSSRDPRFLHAMRWYYDVGRRVWFHEVWELFFRLDHRQDGPTVEEFWGPSLAQHEEALSRQRRVRSTPQGVSAD
ncbi:magnesium-protoporphyrin IX monomethyl ester anaerobic oxidative cyclase [Deinococcus sp. KNUC1210]|uniref:magnesium-protoporphyrin IX monomethyl ester anaerobic oxidative cyclase n=1 Tax=Deinococcus sp. KNUC1210 TaxID=2917691 RepID=UPI001EF000B9|nr:magnesium-protoporphyrin IX monomethyl ester anaerobic oxidative cyclase [Deinococcus sp. KNUC1210]ULH14795.1 magnesium-protoporphyrin IX monomethyl ester anaerobic oxidative cyclase [Deinococcus sp. KNUC1210]